MKDKTGIIIQARMGSTRLPGKTLLELRGKTLIERCVEQARQVPMVDLVVVAIADGPSDIALAKYLDERNILYLSGREDDLISRYKLVADNFNISTVVRLTADNPMVDPTIIERVISAHREGGSDYTSTRHWDGTKFVGLYPKGLMVDVFSASWLNTMLAGELTSEEREHIVYYFANRADSLRLREVSAENCLDYNFSIDSVADFTRIEDLLSRLERAGLDLRYSDYCKLLSES
jgi:spore coat polysaccharide biosynthesis protein SpsF